MIAKRFREKAALAGLAGLLIVLWLPSAVAASELAETFIQQRADEVTAIIANRTATVRDKRSDIWQVIDGSINSEQMARTTLGAYAAPLSQREIDRYVQAFRRYVRVCYAGELASASNLEIKINGSSEMRRSRGTRVTSRVSINGDRGHEVDWRVLDDQFVADVQIDGIWLVSDLRSQLDPVLRQSGGKLNAAIDYLDRQSRGED